MKVNEIFYSIQGEGVYTGTPAAFLRLAGCNMRCDFCDTSHEAFTEMTEEEIVEAVGRYPARHIVITGGEPALQLTATLLNALRGAGFFVQIETNGTMPLPPGADWITCSPKGEPRLQHIDELKVLYWGQDISHHESLPAKERRLQPLDTGDEERNKDITQLTLQYILEHPTWKLSMQTHKILGVR